ncbi:MAG: prepilin-type N-terminal cleavage/methylation domain-containing protein [Clostridiales bacterium]|jgi:prepilin-type N-terminal cleavage/methylation domain-containing protein|nr:prepilin-type N-terminal cleavage/methylation domain-containing protein [Clostridiales bacterium]
MNKIYKNRRAFTLVEIVIVVAIIVLLAAVTGLSVSEYLRDARSASEQLSNSRAASIANNVSINNSFVNVGY